MRTLNDYAIPLGAVCECFFANWILYMNLVCVCCITCERRNFYCDSLYPYIYGTLRPVDRLRSSFRRGFRLMGRPRRTCMVRRHRGVLMYLQRYIILTCRFADGYYRKRPREGRARRKKKRDRTDGQTDRWRWARDKEIVCPRCNNIWRKKKNTRTRYRNRFFSHLSADRHPAVRGLRGRLNDNHPKAPPPRIFVEPITPGSCRGLRNIISSDRGQAR